MPFGNTEVSTKRKAIELYDLALQWAGLSIHFEKGIFTVNQKFLMDLDWIDTPKKMS